MSPMRRTSLPAVCALLGAAFLLAVSLGARPPVEPAGKPAESARDVLRATLPNGLQVVIVRDQLAPVVSAVMNYEVGSNEAPEGFPGMAHAQEHMMFRGSPGLSADQLAEITAAMGGDFDADTQNTVTQYFFTVPADDLNVALRIESLRMRGVDNSEALWAKERGAIEQEVASDLSDPFYVFYQKALATLFADTPYAHDALGTRPSFDKTTAAMLKEFYGKWYAPNNAVYVIAGDVNPPATLAEVKKLFSDIPEKKLPQRRAVKLRPVETETVRSKTDFPFGIAAMTVRMPGTESPDFAASKVLADVLSSRRGSLYALVPAGKALFAEFVSFGDLPRAGMGLALAGFPKGGDGEALIAEMKKILAEDVKNGLPADLVAAAKRRELADTEFRRNSVEGLAFEWSKAVAVEHRNSPDDDVEAMQKVTVADVNRVARDCLTQDHAVYALLTPQPSGKPITHSGFGGKESFASSKVKPVALPKWAAKAVSRLSIPPSMVNPAVSTLPNGIKLIVQQETISRTVSVLGRIKNNPDLEEPKGKEGVAEVLSQLFEFGTTKLDRLAFQKALDDIAAHESAGTDFSLDVLPEHFDRGVELLAENELDPALPAPAFKIVRRKTAMDVAGTLESPGFLAELALDKALYPPEDPVLRHATPASVTALTLEDVQAYEQRVFRPDLTTIVVIGNVAPGEARKAIEKYFGAWKATGPKPPTDYPPAPRNKPSTAVVPDESRVQDSVTLAEALPLTRFNPDYYALELGNHVLGGGFYATRLYRDLRENGGLVYSVGSSFSFGRTRTAYRVTYGCDPPNVTKARAIIVRDLAAMRAAPVTPRELRQAKALLLRRLPLSEASVDRIAEGLLSRSVLGLPLDEPTIAARHYLRLTAAQVKAAFSKWLRPAELVQVTQGPNPQ
jgi:zinc protease